MGVTDRVVVASQQVAMATILIVSFEEKEGWEEESERTIERASWKDLEMIVSKPSENIASLSAI